MSMEFEFEVSCTIELPAESADHAAGLFLDVLRDFVHGNVEYLVFDYVNKDTQETGSVTLRPTGEAA